MMRNSRLQLVALTAVLAACGGDAPEWGGVIADSAGIAVVRNPAQADWRLRPAPRVTEELRIGALDGPAELQFTQIAALDVDGDGNIYVLDLPAAAVRVFDADGRYRRSIGRPGGGPGELSNMTAAVLAGDDGAVYVVDIMRQRIAAFDAEGGEVGSTPVSMQQGIPIRWEIAPTGRFAVQVRALPFPGMDTVTMRDRILLRDPASAAADTLLEMDAGETMRFVGSGPPRVRLFEAEPVWTLLPGNRLARGRTDSDRIEIIGADGALERVIIRPYERRPLTDRDGDAIRDAMAAMLRQQNLPPAAMQQFLQNLEFADYHPAYAVLLAGPENTLWVQHVLTAEQVRQQGDTFNVQNIGSAEWDVFDGDGRLLGTARLPDRFQPLRVVGDRFYGVLRDDLDVQHVARLRLDGW